MAQSVVATHKGTNSFTLGTTQPGDSIVVFAFRDGSTSAPISPSPFGSGTASAGTSCSARWTMSILNSVNNSSYSGQTFTFTNATNIAVYHLRGFSITGFSFPTFSIGTGNTITYPATTGVTSTNKSWTFAFAGHSSTDTNLQTAPATMSNRINNVSGTDEIATHDSNGNVTTNFSSTNVSVGGTSGNWIAATWSYVYNPNRYWIGGSGNWDKTSKTHWAYASGGVGGADNPADPAYYSDTAPLEAYFDNNSTGTIDMTDNLVFYRASFNNFNGTFNTNNYEIKTEQFANGSDLAPPNTQTINLGTSNVKMGEFRATTTNLSFGFFDNLKRENITIDGSDSTISFKNATSSVVFSGGGNNNSFGKVIFDSSSVPVNIRSSNNNTTINIKELIIKGSGARTVSLGSSTINTFNIEAMSINSSVGNVVTLKHLVSGTKAYFNKTTAGALSFNYLDIKDTTVTGGDGWYAGANSTDSGNNLGWTFSNFNLLGITGGDSDLTAEAIGDYQANSTLSGTTDITIDASADMIADADSMSGDTDLIAVGNVRYENELVEGKIFSYKVYDSNNVFLGEFNNVISDFGYSQEVNTAGSQVGLELSLTPEDFAISEELLITESEDPIITEDSIEISSFGKVQSPFGEDALINLNNKVVVSAQFGYADILETQAGLTIDDQDDLPIDITVGSPNGRVIFTGYISKYKLRYGDNNTVVLTLNSYGQQLSNYIIDNSGQTTVSYYSQDPSDILKSILDIAQANGLEAKYSDTSIEQTNTDVTYTYKVNTLQEGINKVLELSPTDWYWYYNMATNEVWLKGRPQNPDHSFILGKHIESLEIENDIGQLINTIYFSGGNIAPEGSPEVYLYKKYQDLTSFTNYGQGLKVLSDERVKLESTADILADNEINRYKDPLFICSAVILTDVYPIEDISLGELVEFKNFGNFIDDLQLQILGIDYSRDKVVLKLGSLLPAVSKRIADIKRNLDQNNVKSVPDTPDS